MPTSMTTGLHQETSLAIHAKVGQPGSVVALLIARRDVSLHDLAKIRTRLDETYGRVPLVTYEPADASDAGWGSNASAGYRRRHIEVTPDGRVTKSTGERLDIGALTEMGFDTVELSSVVAEQVRGLQTRAEISPPPLG